MDFELTVTLTEEDYLAFNRFHSIESPQGKQMIRNSRILMVCAIAAITALFIHALGWSWFTVAYTVVVGLFTAICCLRFKKFTARNLEKQIQKMQKTGRLPFDPESKMVFYADRFVDISPAKRTEMGYEALERICVVDDQYIFLYQSSISANILPIPQIKEQLSYQEFLRFLSQKCSRMEYYFPN